MIKTLVDNDTYTLRVDFADYCPLIHLDVHQENYTPTLHKYFRDVLLEDLLITLGSFGYEMVATLLPIEDKKALKFNKLMGFEVEHQDEEYVLLCKDIV